MTVDRIKLKIINERHHAYRDAFDLCVKKTYLKLLCQFLMDSTLSPSNSDDLELFGDLLFQSKFGRVHIELGRFLCDQALDDPSQGITINKFIQYMNVYSPHHVEDFYQAILKDFGTAFVPIILKYLNADFRVRLAQIAIESHPRLFKAIPKLKTYLLFS